MLRINLLPSYVRQRRLTKRLIPLFAALVLLCVALPLGAYVKMQADLRVLTDHTQIAESAKIANDTLETNATGIRAQVAPIQAKLDFVTAVHAYTRKWVALYNTLADYSPTRPDTKFIYSGVSVNGPVMTIKAYSPSVEAVGRYLQAMYREPDFKTVAVDKIPGYPNNVRHLYYLDSVKPQNLVFADGATGSGGSGGGGGYPGGGGGGGYPGGGGGGGGYPGGGGGGGGYPGGGGGGQGGGSGPAGFNADTLGPNGPGNIPPGVGPPPAELTGGAPSGGGGGAGYPGGGGGGQGGGYSLRYQQLVLRNVYPLANPDVRPAILRQALRRVRRVTVPKGFDITVTATLNNPLSPPTYGGAGGAAGARPGGGGGYPGGGGGYPGGGGGYPGGGGGYPGAYPGGH